MADESSEQSPASQAAGSEAARAVPADRESVARAKLVSASALDFLLRTWRFVLALPFPILGFLSLWILAFKPEWRPWEPPPKRQVEITGVVIAEPKLQLDAEPGLRLAGSRFVTVVLVNVRYVGYNQDSLWVWTEWIDAKDHRRLIDTIQLHGRVTVDTVDDGTTMWLNVDWPPPYAQFQSSHCYFIRVFLTVEKKTSYGFWVKPEPMPEATPIVTVLSVDDVTIATFADSPNFDVHEDRNGSACDAPISGGTRSLVGRGTNSLTTPVDQLKD